MSEKQTVGHFTVTEMAGGRVDIECTKCGMGMDVGPRFGPLRSEDLIAAFVEQHAHKPKQARR